MSHFYVFLNDCVGTLRVQRVKRPNQLSKKIQKFHKFGLIEFKTKSEGSTQINGKNKISHRSVDNLVKRGK